jgi:hypothetical protein
MTAGAGRHLPLMTPLLLMSPGEIGAQEMPRNLKWWGHLLKSYHSMAALAIASGQNL